MSSVGYDFSGLNQLGNVNFFIEDEMINADKKTKSLNDFSMVKNRAEQYFQYVVDKINSKETTYVPDIREHKYSILIYSEVINLIKSSSVMSLSQKNEQFVLLKSYFEGKQDDPIQLGSKVTPLKIPSDDDLSDIKNYNIEEKHKSVPEKGRQIKEYPSSSFKDIRQMDERKTTLKSKKNELHKSPGKSIFQAFGDLFKNKK